MEEVKTLYPIDKLYPSKLKEIKNSPKIIYYLGKISNDGPHLSVTGSRDCSQRSKDILDKIIRGLPSEVVIVSGLARGIDTTAHMSAIKYGHKTIAVLPSGINRIYPEENIELAKKIIENNGLLISEYPNQEKPTGFSFVQRDRIISGLASAVLVAEAKFNSGTMNTVKFAKNQQKIIYAIPGSEGCDYLISNGIPIAYEAKDICL